MSEADACYRVADDVAMRELGGALADTIAPGQVWTLHGDLGAGKTTLVRGVLRGLGFEGRVKSPSYGLIESYAVRGIEVHHLDLYRLGDPGELDFIGLEDLLTPNSVLLIEWPERAAGRLPPVTHRIGIEFDGTARTVRVNAAPTCAESRETGHR